MKKTSITAENQKNDHLNYLRTSASETECTGMVYTGLLSEEELEALNEIYPFQPESTKKTTK